MAKQIASSLAGKKDLIFHTYDSFLTAQTRLFSRATSHERSKSEELVRRSELLFLDDLIAFSISARRLLELTKLKSYANKFTIAYAFLDNTEEPYVVGKSNRKTIGFLTLVNRIIHASMIVHYDDMLSCKLAFMKLDEKTRHKIIFNELPKTHRKHFEQLLFIASDANDPVLISLLDTINVSIAIAEKIVDTCAQQHIFLELSLRGID